MWERQIVSMIGFDDLFKEVEKNLNNKPSTYPPFNIINRDVDEDVGEVCDIEIACAGFSREDLEVTLDKRELLVEGKTEKNETNDVYKYRGFAKRNFKHRFTLSEHTVILYCDFTDGVLTIGLGQEIPEDQKPQKIDIN